MDYAALDFIKTAKESTDKATSLSAFEQKLDPPMQLESPRTHLDYIKEYHHVKSHKDFITPSYKSNYASVEFNKTLPYFADY